MFPDEAPEDLGTARPRSSLERRPEPAAGKPEEAVLTQIEPVAAPTLIDPDAIPFYSDALAELSRLGFPFLLAGTYAVSAYTGIRRPTKDLDVFCRAGDYPRILDHFQKIGHTVSIEDERWLAKVHKGDAFFDVIFASSNGTMPVNDQWFENAHTLDLFGTRVRIVGPTELIWSKAFIQLRHRFDGADIVHVILKKADEIDWKRLLNYMELHWEVLLGHLLAFRWCYPTDRDQVPRWLMDELLDRLKHQLELPPPDMKVCRGRMLSRIDFALAV